MNMQEKIDLLNKATEAYDAGSPIMSDENWDKIYFELVQEEKDTGVVLPESPSRAIHYEKVSSLKTAIHEHPMLSLDKTKDENTLKSFLKDKDYILMPKLDGLTTALTYENHKLVKAETRGNGYVGEDVTHNAYVIGNIPKYIPLANKLVVFGEVICKTHDFEIFKEEYKNPRNFAAGSLRLLDSEECVKRHLSFIAWDCPEGLEQCNTLSEKLIYLDQELNFESTFFHDRNSSISLEQFKQDAAELGYPIDGIVAKYDNVEYYESLGTTAHHPQGALAFKFYDETYVTNLISIDWTMGRNGTLTPVAVFAPVEINSNVIQRASLHNVSVMYETLGKYPYKGEQLEICLCNQIIPQVVSAEQATAKDLIELKLERVDNLNKCPYCGCEVTPYAENNATVMRCENDECCGKTINIIDHYCSRKGMDIKGLSKATLEKLLDWGWIATYADVYTLATHRSEWIKKDGFGDKSVDKILDAIEKSKKCTLEQFIAAIGIPLIGTNVAKELVKYFPDYTELRERIEAGDYNFAKLPNFGYAKAKEIMNFDYFEADRCAHYLTFVNKNDILTTEENNHSSLTGLTIVITGKLNNFKNREALKSKIESCGGKVVNTVTKKTDYLINNDTDSSSSKNLTAKKLNVAIISEENFLKKFDL